MTESATGYFARGSIDIFKMEVSNVHKCCHADGCQTEPPSCHGRAEGTCVPTTEGREIFMVIIGAAPPRCE
jgi:hypothetical protein